MSLIVSRNDPKSERQAIWKKIGNADAISSLFSWLGMTSSCTELLNTFGNSHQHLRLQNTILLLRDEYGSTQERWPYHVPSTEKK
jgi:hypothetical protein